MYVHHAPTITKPKPAKIQHEGGQESIAAANDQGKIIHTWHSIYVIWTCTVYMSAGWRFLRGFCAQAGRFRGRANAGGHLNISFDNGVAVRGTRHASPVTMQIIKVGGIAAIAALALLWRRLRHRPQQNTTAVAVTVASTSSIKCGAVRRAFLDAFPGAVTLIGVNAPSRVNDQPVGLLETRAGAENRIAEATAFAREQRLHATGRGSTLHFVVSVENGLVRLPDDEAARWIDLAVVIIALLGDGESRERRAYAISGGVEVPAWAVDKARQKGFGSITVGSVVAQEQRRADPTMSGAVNAKDPHSFLTCGAAPRAALIESAVRTALGTLQRKLE